MLPDKLKQLLKYGQPDTFCTQPCEKCIKDPCCKLPGYATFENTLEIYKVYKENKLKREDDVSFKKGLTFKQFVLQYFIPKMHPVDNSFILFHPKVIKNKNKNYGCIFCKRKIKNDSNDVYKNCMLWSEDRFDKITTFPIGCINNGCSKEFIETRETLIHHFYPNSHDNFTKTK